MSHLGPDQPQADIEPQLFELVKRERLARDTQDWHALEDSYWPGARVRVTWFDGPVADFVTASRASVRPGRIGGFHTIDPTRSEIAEDRALVESRGQVLLRPSVDGVECDLTSWCRFVAGLERREGRWRMAFFDNIYVKDRIDPLEPGASVPTDPALVEGARPSYRWLTYTNRKRGIDVPDDLPGDDRRDLVEAFWSDAREWLQRP